MREGEPVGAVGEEGELGVGLDEGAAAHFTNWCLAELENGMAGGELGENFEFGFERESGDAADDEAENKKRETQAKCVLSWEVASESA